MMIRGTEVAGRTIALTVGALVVIAALIWGPTACQMIRSQHAQSKVDKAQAGAAAESGGDAVETTAAAGHREAGSEELTRTNEREIRAAEGADQRINPAAQAAGLRALCRREAYRGTERCKIFLKEPQR